MAHFHPRSTFTPSELQRCQRVFDQICAEYGFDHSSLAAQQLASSILLTFQGGTTEERTILASARIKANEQPYEAGCLAKKHGVTVEAAGIIIGAYGPSKEACDASAERFAKEIAVRHRQWQRD